MWVTWSEFDRALQQKLSMGEGNFPIFLLTLGTAFSSPTFSTGLAIITILK